MFLNYLKIAFRSLIKRRLFTVVNLLGLVLGLVAFLGLFAYVATEWSFNDFHANKDSIYRVVVKEGNESYETYLPPGYEDVLEINFQDIASSGRIASFIGGGLLAIPQTDFPYKAGLSFWTFASAGILTLIIALLTVGFQALKAAWANPAETLKSE
jgi:putative ABC transport system permease protein